MSKTRLAVMCALALAGACSKKKVEDAPASASSAAAGSSAMTGAAPGSAGAGSAGAGSAGAGNVANAGGSATGSAAAAPVDAPAPIPPYEPSADVPPAIRDAVKAADRSDDDRRLDAGRHPAEVLAFFKVAPGQKIGELFAGGGYTTELLARVVGDKGKVFAQNTKEVMDRFARGPWTERAKKPVMAPVVGVERPTDDPFPAEAKQLDAVITILNYHDFVWQKADRAKLNKAVFAALKKGGVYGIVDHSAQAGSGTRDTETLHRIDEDVVKKEVLAAGFKLDGESELLRNPDDKRDWNSSPKAAGEKRGTSDRFTLRFIKP